MSGKHANLYFSPRKILAFACNFEFFPPKMSSCSENSTQILDILFDTPLGAFRLMHETKCMKILREANSLCVQIRTHAHQNNNAYNSLNCNPFAATMKESETNKNITRHVLSSTLFMRRINYRAKFRAFFSVCSVGYRLLCELKHSSVGCLYLSLPFPSKCACTHTKSPTCITA